MFMSPERVRQVSQPVKFGTSMPLFNVGRVETLRGLIDAGLTGRMADKWAGVLAVNNAYMPVGPVDPFDIPPYYDDPEANNEVVSIIRADGMAAVDLGVRWRVLRSPADAAAVARIITPWTQINTIVNNGESRLVWSYNWPLFIQAAQLIQDSPAYTSALKSAMEAMTEHGLTYSSSHQTANRAMWGVVLDISSAAFLKDRARFKTAISRWRELFDVNIVGNVPIGEVGRDSNGLYYCNFMLNAMTQAAEIARFNGEWLYDYTAPDGSTFRGLWEKVARWTAHPSEFPYWPGSTTPRIQAHVDPLHALWPNANSQLLIENYTTTQDFVGYRQGILAYRHRPLWG